MQTLTDTEYAEGRSRGYAAGEHDLAEGLGNHHDRLAEARERVETAHSRSQRTYLIGYLRGYREAVRTLRWVRWGT